MIRINPAIKLRNIKLIRRLVDLGALANSFQINIPQSAATNVQDWASPYEMAKPAVPDASMLKFIPKQQITPPRILMECVLTLPLLKKSLNGTGSPSKGLFIM